MRSRKQQPYPGEYKVSAMGGEDKVPEVSWCVPPKKCIFFLKNKNVVFNEKCKIQEKQMS